MSYLATCKTHSLVAKCLLPWVIICGPANDGAGAGVVALPAIGGTIDTEGVVACAEGL